MSLTLIATVATLGLFLGMLLFLELGHRAGLARLKRSPDGLVKGGGPAEGAVFGLLGLLVAFTFSGAATRFEDRRHLVTEEANAIGTAWLRIDLLPADAQPELRDLFRRYLDQRLKVYRNAEDIDSTIARQARSVALQADLWARALKACQRPEAPGHACMLMVPALNAMFDITTTRATAARNHPPPIIFLMIAGLSLMGAVLVGYGLSDNRKRHWLHPVAYAAIMSLAVYVIIDLEFPRLGLIRVDAVDQVLMELRQGMDQGPK